MKATVIYKDTKIKKEHHKLFNQFIYFLNKKFPLNTNIKIIFTNERYPKMTTGSFIDDEIIILVDDRINRDILRTLAHEWVHFYQHKILKRKKSKDIGGKNEDEANAFAGRIIKMFELSHPKLDKKLYQH